MRSRHPYPLGGPQNRHGKEANVVTVSKLWVMRQFQPSLDAVGMKDTKARDHFGIHLQRVMDILHIESSEGLLSFYL